MNTYGYVGGNPLNYTDPTGQLIPVIAACAANPVCVAAAATTAKAIMGAGIGGMSALVGALSDPCFKGDLAEVFTGGAMVGAATSLVSPVAPLSSAFIRGAGAGFLGDTYGQVYSGGFANYDVIQSGGMGLLGAASLVTANYFGLQAAITAFRSGASFSEAMSIGASNGGAMGILVEAIGNLSKAAWDKNNSDCKCNGDT